MGAFWIHLRKNGRVLLQRLSGSPDMRHKYRLCLADVFATQGVNEKSVLKMSRSAFAEPIELNKSTPVVLSRIPKLQDYVTNHPTFDSGIRQKVKLAIQSKES